MKNFLPVIATLFYSLISIQAQDSVTHKESDSLENISLNENSLPVTSEAIDNQVNEWQLSEHLLYESYPEKIQDTLSFIKGKEFLNLNANGEYQSILNNTFNSGIWLQNRKLIVCKQKVPTTYDVYYEIIEETDSFLKLKKAAFLKTFWRAKQILIKEELFQILQKNHFMFGLKKMPANQIKAIKKWYCLQIPISTIMNLMLEFPPWNC